MAALQQRQVVGGGGGAASDDDEFAHPCPICLDNEDCADSVPRAGR